MARPEAELLLERVATRFQELNALLRPFATAARRCREGLEVFGPLLTEVAITSIEPVLPGERADARDADDREAPADGEA